MAGFLRQTVRPNTADRPFREPICRRPCNLSRNVFVIAASAEETARIAPNLSGVLIAPRCGSAPGPQKMRRACDRCLPFVPSPVIAASPTPLAEPYIKTALESLMLDELKIGENEFCPFFCHSCCCLRRSWRLLVGVAQAPAVSRLVLVGLFGKRF